MKEFKFSIFLKIPEAIKYEALKLHNFFIVYVNILHSYRLHYHKHIRLDFFALSYKIILAAIENFQVYSFSVPNSGSLAIMFCQVCH
jgi:hypothetical protein